MKNPKATQRYYQKHKRGKKRVEYISFFPYDPVGCPCKGEITRVKKIIHSMDESQRETYRKKEGYVLCPKNKKGLIYYHMECSECGEKVASFYAKNKNINEHGDWCDFHYRYATFIKDNEAYWAGCYDLNIRDNKVRVGCACGNSITEDANPTFDKDSAKFIIKQG